MEPPATEIGQADSAINGSWIPVNGAGILDACLPGANCVELSPHAENAVAHVCSIGPSRTRRHFTESPGTPPSLTRFAVIAAWEGDPEGTEN